MLPGAALARCHSLHKGSDCRSPDWLASMAVQPGLPGLKCLPTLRGSCVCHSLQQGGCQLLPGRCVAQREHKAACHGLRAQQRGSSRLVKPPSCLQGSLSHAWVTVQQQRGCQVGYM